MPHPSVPAWSVALGGVAIIGVAVAGVGLAVGHPTRRPNATPGGTEGGAREVLEAAIAAHGGRPRFEAVRGVTLDVDGELRMMGQSRRPDGPLDVEPMRSTVHWDRQGDRFLQDAENTYPIGFVLRFREVVGAHDGFTVELTQLLQGRRLNRTPPEGAAARRAAMLRELGPFLLLPALEHGRDLRLGRSAGGQDVVELDDGAGPIALHFDARSHLLVGYERTGQHPLVGAVRTTTELAGYRRQDGLLLPSERRDARNGAPALDARLRWRLGDPPADSLFALPADYREVDTSVARPVSRLADGVHLLRYTDGNFGLAVEFSDHLFVMEAPTSSGRSEAAIAALAAAIPGKPIRYVAFTHHHTDHAGGLRPYIARGVTVVAPAPYREFVERLAAVTYPSYPDSLSRAPRAPIIETFSGQRVFADGHRRLELHEVSPNSHSVAMVYAWVPAAGIVYDGDGAIVPSDVPVRPVNRLAHELAAVLARDGVADRVATIVNTHSGIVTAERFRAALAASRSAP